MPQVWPVQTVDGGITNVETSADCSAYRIFHKESKLRNLANCAVPKFCLAVLLSSGPINRVIIVAAGWEELEPRVGRNI